MTESDKPPVAIQTMPHFEGKSIRTVQHDGETWIPISDLAAAWGVDRTTPHNIIFRNREIFSGLVHYDGDVTSQPGICVNERGLYLLMGKVSASRLKNPAAKETVIRFQRWVPELVQKYRKGELAAVPAIPSSFQVREALRTAKVIAEECGINRQVVFTVALRKIGLGEYADALRLESGVSYLNVSDISERIGKTAHEVNTRLWQYLKLQEPDPANPKEYRLTDKGREYGDRIPFVAENGHAGTMIRWRWKVLELFNVRGVE